MKSGLKETFDEELVKLAHREFMEICPYCGDHIHKFQYYVVVEDNTWHYKCKKKSYGNRSEFYGAYGSKVKSVE